MTPILAKADLDYSTMSIADLTAEALRLATVLEVCNDQRRQIFGLIEKRQADAAAAERVATMSAAQKDALRSVLGTP